MIRVGLALALDRLALLGGTVGYFGFSHSFPAEPAVGLATAVGTGLTDYGGLRVLER